MPDRESAIQSMLEAVRLNKEKSNPSSSFSGGMKRRLSVAIASLGDKRVVVLDEPTTGMVSLKAQTFFAAEKTNQVCNV